MVPLCLYSQHGVVGAEVSSTKQFQDSMGCVTLFLKNKNPKRQRQGREGEKNRVSVVASSQQNHHYRHHLPTAVECFPCRATHTHVRTHTHAHTRTQVHTHVHAHT